MVANQPPAIADTPWKEPLHDPGPAVVFDIDGVLADMRPFQYLIEAETSRQKQWSEFHRKFEKATPIKAGLITAKRIYDELDIDVAYSTTRPEQHARRTLRWFEKNDLPMGPIQFRHFVRDGPRPAIDVKLRHWWYWQDRWAEKNPVLAWIEDDPAAMHALRAHGCPAWGPNELKVAARKQSSLKAALEAGPEDWDVLAKAKKDSYKRWRVAEDEWQAVRKQWWQEERQRQRQRRVERNPRGQGRR
ncbi:MAG: hypothetical protein DI630_13435 [Gordonia sp. (in: high G+C Gram-positive bacteria)]|nr:MAG: hypothetical protein DI630_13435 [Gordonia sp. (in: high G+C Gram-positive bacteria)]